MKIYRGNLDKRREKTEKLEGILSKCESKNPLKLSQFKN